jgi:hypothetical protein
MNDNEIEKEICEKNLTAPRITPDLIASVIVGETYTKLPSGRTLICELTLKNGYTVRGESSCVSIENFDLELGKKISREDAKNKVWQLEGYLLKEQLFNKE